MKPKPTSHKATNTYKFESFHERLEKINISTISHLKRRFDADEADDNLPFFALALEKWSDLNCTQDYQDIQQRIGSNLNYQNLRQVLHRKKQTAEILIDGLKVPGSKALNAILELIVALARDILDEFYELEKGAYFATILEQLVSLTCQATEIEDIEGLFVCQTFLFKYLRKWIIRDIAKHFVLLKPALKSKKEHVLNFSSEVFAFLVKNAKQQADLIQLLFDNLAEDSDLDRAVGRILFESVKGVNQQYHSKAKQLFDIIFSKFVHSTGNHFDEMMHYFLVFLLEYSSKDSFRLVWNYLLLDKDRFSRECLSKVIPLVNVAVTFRRGKLLSDSSQKLITLTNYLSFHRLDLSTTSTVLDSIENIFNNHDSELSLEKVNQFCEYFYQSAYTSSTLSLDQIFTFTKKVFSCSIFDIVLKQYCCALCSTVIQKSSNSDSKVSCFQFLAHLLVVKRPRPVFGEENDRLLTRYQLSFENNSKIVEDAVLKHLSTTANPEEMLYCVILIPHLQFLLEKTASIGKAISTVVLKQTECFQTSSFLIGQLLFEAIVALALLKEGKQPIVEITAECIIQLFKQFPSSTELLQSLDIYLSYNRKTSGQKALPVELLAEMYPLLQSTFSSPLRLNRILALHIVTLFELPLPAEANGESVFSICLEAELTEPELATYRERLRHVRKLECNLVACHIPHSLENVDFDFESASVYYLLGSLYENLSLLWKPTIEVLATYAPLQSTAKDNKRPLLTVLFEHLKTTDEFIRSTTATAESSHPVNVYEQLFDVKSRSKLMSGLSSSPDHYNHRILLLNAFESFSTAVEPRNREFVDRFFEFVQQEMKSRFVYISSCRENLRSRSEEEENEEENEEEEGEQEEAVAVADSKGDLKFQWKTFFAYLSVFGKFKNPKALYREVELTAMYMNLLVSPNGGLQRHAMKCLFTYGHSYINKYREQLLRLLEEKTFSSEIYRFVQHDTEEDNVISEDDRPLLMPIFLRLLYGKLLSSLGNKVHGKNKGEYLRSTILKVISGFDEADQLAFMELIYVALKPLIEAEYGELLPTKVAAFVDVGAFFVPFRQFNSLISTLECLMKHFGGRSLSVKRLMLKVLVVCSAVANQLLAAPNRLQLKPYLVGQLKAYRTSCYKVAQHFFLNFDHYPFTAEEVDALFAVLVQPMVGNLSTESLDSPTPMLRLLGTWSENARYYVLLAKQVDGTSSLTPLLSILQLYSHPKVSASTVAFISGIIENLLTLDGEKVAAQEATVGPAIEVNNFGRQLAEVELPKGETVSFGARLLIPHLKTILDRIYANYAGKIANNSKFEFTLQEVNILARLSFFVKDATDSASFSTLLLYSISQVRRPEEDKEVFTLKTLNHLAKNLNDEKDIRRMLHLSFPLFQLISRPLSRRELCTFVGTLCMKNSQLKPMLALITEINSYDVRQPEEPDYNRRIGGFKAILQLLENDFDQSNLHHMDFVHLLLENCAFMLNTYDDLSLRDLSSTVLVKVCHLLANCSQALFDRYVMGIIFYRLISGGLRQPKESTRHEYIGVLVEAARIFSDRHEVVRQLRSLSAEEAKNEELDFWLNIKHIQLHRRARALNRLAADAELLGSLSSRVFTSFLIPLANSFIVEPTHYAKNVALFGAAVESLASFLQHCSWSKYDSTLSSYIHRLLSNKLEPKIAIRIISAMLAKFSFLKPAEVAQIEKDLKADDLKNMSLEYSVAWKKSKGGKGKNEKGGKFGKGKKKGVDKKSAADEVTKQTTKEIVDEAQKADESIIEEAVEKEEPVEDMEEGEDDTEEEQSGDRLTQARKIYQSLCRKLLPLLHRCLHQRAQIEYANDARDFKDEEFVEDKEIQRIPIALAIVKLLSHVRINEQLFNANVTSIFLRLCQFLQSRATSIREASRSTLVQVMQTLGPKYFGEIFYEMRSLLTRGYQKHIFIFTVYALLNSLRDQLKYGDLDRVLGDVISLCHQEMFGALAEEKEVTHITTKTKEAKKLKSYDIYEILAQFVSQAALTGLLTPLKEVLTSTGSHTVVKKTETAFEKICRGLVGNRSLTVQSLVPVLLQIMATAEAAVVGASTAADASASAADESGKIQRLAEKLPSKVDSYLIPAKSLRRVHQTARLNRSSNLHVMADFALTTVLHLIKQNRLVTVEESHREMLEPMVDQLATFLHSKDTKVITSSMKVLHSLLVKFPDLQSFRATTQTIISQIFVLLRKYSGLAANEGSQLVTLCFKTIAHFVNNRADCKLNDDELAVLLSYAESDIESNSQNATIYLLLKAIIRRKFASKELHRLMERLLVLAITTEIDHVRSHAVELTIKYLTEYPIDGNRFKGKMVKLVRQLEFSNLSGRLAAITILKSVIGMLDAKTLSPLKVTLFVPIASRIVNEESTECKRLISATVLTILGKLELADRDNLFETFIEPWLTCDDILVRTLASHLVTQLVKHEKHYFEKRLSACLPLVCQQLDPSRYSGSLGQKATEGGEEVEEVDGTVSAELRNEDNLIFHHLTFVLHLLQLKPFTSSDSGVHFSIVEVLTKAKYYEDFNLIFEYIASTYLLHPHSWIRCLATQIFGQLFSLWSDPQSFIDDVHLYKNAYLFVNTEEVLFNLGKKFCLIFRDIYNCSTVSEQLMKNLVYIARVLIELDGSHEEEEDASERKVSLRWLINKLLFEVKFEVKSSPENYQKRSLLAKWIAAVVFALYGEEKRRKDRVVKYLPSLLPPLCREDLSTSNEGETADASVKKAKEELASLHRQVHEMLKSRLGAQLYHDYYNQVRNEITHRKLERKKSRAIQMITQNDAGVKRKQRKHKRDRVALSAKRRRLVR